MNRGGENNENYCLYRKLLSSKGSREVVTELQRLIAENHLEDSVELSGTFCMGNCQMGVCVTVDGNLFSLTPEKTKSFFETEVLAKVKA